MNWYAMSDKALCETMGAFIKKHRLDQNRTQEQLAEQAGISRSTLSLLERGEPVTLPTLIQVLRVLELLHVLEAFQIKEEVSPLQLARQQRDKRQRARTSGKNQTDSEW